MLIKFTHFFSFLLILSFASYSSRTFGQSYNMPGSGVINTCSGTFYDSGGPTDSYNNNQDRTVTFCSHNGLPLSFTFTHLSLENNDDFLYVYDGATVSAPLMATLTGNNLPGVITSSTGCITFRFDSDVLWTYSGWAATITSVQPCTAPPPPPDPTDCATATKICGNGSLNYNSLGAGVDEFPVGIGCIQAGEHQSSWYEVYVSGSGTLAFDIIPNAGNSEDYDFAVWGPNPDCGNLGDPLRCSFADDGCTYCPSTGMDPSFTDLSEPSTGDGYVAAINAQVGDRYLILVDNYNSSAEGFVLNWTGTAQLGNITVDAGPDLAVCYDESFTLQASQNGGNFPYYKWTATPNNAITFLSNPSELNPTCVIPSSYTGGPITYALSVVENSCNGADQIVVTPGNLSLAGTVTDPNCTQTTGGIDQTITGSSGPFVLTWSGGLPATEDQANLAPGTYSVTVTSALGCEGTATYQINTPPPPPSVSLGQGVTLTCTNPTTIPTPTVSGGNAPLIYTWSGGLSGANPTITSAGSYGLTVTDAGGCSGTASIQVLSDIVLPDDVAVIGGEVNCLTPVLTIQASGASLAAPNTFTWSGPAFVGGQQTLTPQVNQAGSYQLLVTNPSNGCTYSAAAAVTKNTEAPQVEAGADGQLTCIVTNYSPVATITGAINPGYQWVASQGGVITSGQQSLSPVIAQAGMYKLTATNPLNGCVGSDSLMVTENTTPPMAMAGQDVLAPCGDTAAALSVTGSSEGFLFTYLWSTAEGHIVTPANGSVITVDASGVYKLLVSNTQNGCTDSDEVYVSVNRPQPTAVVERISPDCFGELGFISIQGMQGGAPPYLYSIDGGATYGKASDFEDLPAGTYQVMLKDTAGCVFTETIVFDEILVPEVTAQLDNFVAFGQETQLEAETNLFLAQIDTIIWSPSTFLTDTQHPLKKRVATYDNMEYQVTVISNTGCIDQATIRLFVEAPGVWAPNAISPVHGEGPNKFFTIFSAENTVETIANMEVFDRWGNMVYSGKGLQTNIPSAGWDGTMHGKPLSEGVYVWTANIVLANGKKLALKGDITLLD